MTLAVLATGPAQGQLTVRVVGGIGTSWIHNDMQAASSRGDEIKIEPRASWLAGSEVHYQATPRFSVSSGLLCASYAGHDGLFVRGSLNTETDRRLTYLLLPLLVNFHLGAYRIGAGYQMGYLIDAGGTASNYGGQFGGADQVYELDPMPVIKMDIGVVGHLGFAPTDRWDLGLRFYQGLQNINDYRTGFSYTLRNQQIVLAVSHRIHQRKQAAADTEPVSGP